MHVANMKNKKISALIKLNKTLLSVINNFVKWTTQNLLKAFTCKSRIKAKLH